MHAVIYISLEPRPLLFPQHWMHCITSTRVMQIASSAAEIGGVWVRDYIYITCMWNQGILPDPDLILCIHD